MPVTRKLRTSRGTAQGPRIKPVPVVISKKKYGGKRRKPFRGFTAVQSQTIAKAIGRAEETKYYAVQLAENLTLDPSIHTMGADIQCLAPQIPQGTGSHQRDGSKVSPVRSYVDVVATFNQNFPSGVQNPAIMTAKEIYVVMYLLSPKQQKTWTQYRNDPVNYTGLLDDGQTGAVGFGDTGGASPSLTTNTKFLQYPINQTRHRLIRKKVIKLVRNDGGMNSGTLPSVGTNLPSSVWKGRFYFRLPKLSYDDSPTSVTGGFPTNACPVIMFGYCNADNTTTPVPQSADYNWLSVTARLHCWYKDS